MSGLELKIDAEQVAKAAGALRQIGQSSSGALARAINHTGDKAKTAMTRALTVQTGLKKAVFVKALKVTRASAKGGRMAYTIRSAGGNVSLKYFGAKETPAGVSAAVRGARKTYAGTFMRAGWWPKRVVKPGWHGQVFRRAGGKSRKGMDKFEKVKSDLFIPEEMVSGASAAAFQSVVGRDLPARVEHELLRAMKGEG